MKLEGIVGMESPQRLRAQLWNSIGVVLNSSVAISELCHVDMLTGPSFLIYKISILTEPTSNGCQNEYSLLSAKI